MARYTDWSKKIMLIVLLICSVFSSLLPFFLVFRLIHLVAFSHTFLHKCGYVVCFYVCKSALKQIQMYFQYINKTLQQWPKMEKGERKKNENHQEQWVKTKGNTWMIVVLIVCAFHSLSLSLCFLSGHSLATARSQTDNKNMMKSVISQKISTQNTFVLISLI